MSTVPCIGAITAMSPNILKNNFYCPINRFDSQHKHLIYNKTGNYVITITSSNQSIYICFGFFLVIQSYVCVQSRNNKLHQLDMNYHEL